MKRVWNMKKRKVFTIRDAYEFNKLHNIEGMTLRRIASLYKTTHTVIRNNLKKYGFSWRSRQYLLDETYFKNLDNLEKQYLLGWIYSDGCVFAYEDKKYYGFAIKIQEQDQYILTYFKGLLCSDKDIQTDFTDGRRYSKLIIGSKKIYDDLLKYGLTQRKTHIIEYPVDIITDHRPFILGIFEGDGSIHIDKSTKMPTFQIVGTQKLMTAIRDILAKELNLNSVPIRKHKNSYTFAFCGTNSVRIIGEWLYSWNPPAYLRRKRERFEEVYTMPKYGKSFMVYKCPQCGSYKEYEQRLMYQLKKYTFKSRFCSLSCSGKFYRRYQLNGYKLTPEMELGLKENFVRSVKYYKLTNKNGKFVDFNGPYQEFYT